MAELSHVAVHCLKEVNADRYNLTPANRDAFLSCAEQYVQAYLQPNIEH